MTNDKNIEKELVSLTSKLISFKTVSGNFNEINKCVAFIKNYFRGFKVQELTQNKVKSLIISVDGKKKKEIFLTGHIDVVPAESNQFKPITKQGKIFGRGSCDMKSGVAIAMLLMKNLKPKNVSLILTGDEELGGQNGMGFVAKKGYRANFVISTEAGLNEDITTKHKGVIWMKIKAKGKSAHGSRPWLGINAAEKLILAYVEIRKKFKDIKINDSFNKKWQKTINLGMISAGSGAFNKIPDCAELGIDIRYTEKDNSNKIIYEIKNISKKHNCVVEIYEKEPMLLNKKNKYIDLLKKISGMKEKSEFGASDVRYFSDKGIPSVDLNVKGKNYHGKNEFVYIKSIIKICKILERFINQLREK